jgi:hypothetical protein
MNKVKYMKYLLPIMFTIIFISCEHEVKVVFPDTIQSEIEQYIRKQEYIAVIYVDTCSGYYF